MSDPTLKTHSISSLCLWFLSHNCIRLLPIHSLYAQTPNAVRGFDPTNGSLPWFLNRYTDIAIYGLAIGTVLCLLALFTNRVPDPSFPWATLAPGMRLPVEQPRIEHWPVSYTAGIWLWIFGFLALPLGLPALFEAYRRLSQGDVSGSVS